MNSPRPSARRRILGYVIRLVIGLGLFALAVWSNQAEIANVFQGQPRLELMGLGFLLYFSGVLLAYLRWLVLVRALQLPLRWLDAFRLGFIGTLFNLVIPGAVGGDFVKAAYFLRELPERKTQAAASIAIDRIIGLLGLFVLAVLFGSFGWMRLDPPLRRLVITAWLLTGVVCAVLAIAFSPGLFRALVVRLTKRPRLAAALHEFARMGSAYRERLGSVGLSLGMATVTHILNVLAFFAVSRALFSVVPSLSTHFLIVPLVLFSTAIPLPFGALGVSEQVSDALFQLTNYNGGAVAMMGFRVLQYTGGIFALIVYLANQSRSPVATPPPVPEPIHPRPHRSEIPDPEVV